MDGGGGRTEAKDGLLNDRGECTGQGGRRELQGILKSLVKKWESGLTQLLVQSNEHASNSIKTTKPQKSCTSSHVNTFE